MSLRISRAAGISMMDILPPISRDFHTAHWQHPQGLMKAKLEVHPAHRWPSPKFVQRARDNRMRIQRSRVAFYWSSGAGWPRMEQKRHLGTIRREPRSVSHIIQVRSVYCRSRSRPPKPIFVLGCFANFNVGLRNSHSFLAKQVYLNMIVRYV